jgi:hypothetical protein
MRYPCLIPANLFPIIKLIISFYLKSIKIGSKKIPPDFSKGILSMMIAPDDQWSSRSEPCVLTILL